MMMVQWASRALSLLPCSGHSFVFSKKRKTSGTVLLSPFEAVLYSTYPHPISPLTPRPLFILRDFSLQITSLLLLMTKHPSRLRRCLPPLPSVA